MGEAVGHRPVLPLLVAFSGDASALDWARQQASAAWGPAALESPTFDFAETDYYDASMGPGLLLRIVAFERGMTPDELVERKLATNAWERAYAQGGACAHARPLNLDPGYLTTAKLVLASTKDHSHRLYLGRGIFGEVTLHFTGGAWQPRPWTYPNYRRADYHQFFVECREWLRRRERERA